MAKSLLLREAKWVKYSRMKTFSNDCAWDKVGKISTKILNINFLVIFFM